MAKDNIIFWIVGIVLFLIVANNFQISPNFVISNDIPITVCPTVCVEMWKITYVSEGVGGICEFNKCGSGCGPNNVNTFATKSECETKIDRDTNNSGFNFNDLFKEPSFYIIIGVGLILYLLFRKE